MIGECGYSEDKACLIAVLELEKTNAVIINQKVIQTLTDLNKGEINYKNLKFVISDQKHHMLWKVGNSLKVFLRIWSMLHASAIWGIENANLFEA